MPGPRRRAPRSLTSRSLTRSQIARLAAGDAKRAWSLLRSPEYNRAGPWRWVALLPREAWRRVRSLEDTPNTGNITTLLRAAASGQRGDLDALMAAIYTDMRRIADNHLRAERLDHTLQPTALVHEAYLKLIDQRGTNWKDRTHFFAIASRIIRRILVDHARQKGAVKRGSGRERVSLEHAELSLPSSDVDLVALDDALEELATLDARQAQIVELRFFGGLTLAEIAETLNMGRRSVDRSWSAAKAWLFFRLSDNDAESGLS